MWLWAILGLPAGAEASGVAGAMAGWSEDGAGAICARAAPEIKQAATAPAMGNLLFISTLKLQGRPLMGFRIGNGHT